MVRFVRDLECHSMCTVLAVLELDSQIVNAVPALCGPAAANFPGIDDSRSLGPRSPAVNDIRRLST